MREPLLFPESVVAWAVWCRNTQEVVDVANALGVTVLAVTPDRTPGQDYRAAWVLVCSTYEDRERLRQANPHWKVVLQGGAMA